MSNTSQTTHIDISPAILYWGTPVVLIATTNPNGTFNIAPMSSIFWLGHNCMIGLETGSQTTRNIQRTGTCTLNLASDDMKDAVNALARTTGSCPVSEGKAARGYKYVQDKFAHASLTPLPSSTSSTPGIAECPSIMEAELVAEHSWFKDQPTEGACLSFELHVTRVKVREELKMTGFKNRIDTDKWKPMIMMFSELYGLRDGKVVESVLASIEEELYRPFTGTTG